MGNGFEAKGMFSESPSARAHRLLEEENKKAMLTKNASSYVDNILHPFDSKKNEAEKKPIAVFELDMARHSKKAKTEREELTDEGLQLAAKKGLENDAGSKETFEKVRGKLNSGEALEVWGSPRERTIQTSTLRMLGEQFKDATFGNLDPKDLVEWLKSGDKLKEKNDDLLNFLPGSGKYTKEMEDAYFGISKDENGNEIKVPPFTLKWMVENSDKDAIEQKLSVTDTTSFSTHAGNVAQFIKKLGKSKVNEMFNKGKKEDFAFATSHQTVLESFLYKALAKVSGKGEADAFLASRQAGFDFNEGFKIDFEVYSKDLNDWAVNLTYNGKKYKIEPKILNEIIMEGLEQEEDMRESVKGNRIPKRKWRDIEGEAVEVTDEKEVVEEDDKKKDENLEDSLEKENVAEQYGRNVRVVNYWNRHAQKESGDINSATGGLSTKSISEKGFTDSVQFGKGIDASSFGVLQTYVSKVKRTTETAEGILGGYKEKNPGAEIKGFKTNERLGAGGVEYPKDFFDLYSKIWTENKKKLMIEKGINPDDFDKLSPTEQANIAEVAEGPIIQEWLTKGSELSKLFDPKIPARDFGRLFYFHTLRMPGLSKNGSEFDLLHVTHRAIMEPFLVSGVLTRARDNKRITDLKELGGAMNLIEGWKSITETDGTGKKNLIVELRGEKYNVDMDMLKEMGRPRKSMATGK